MGLILLDSCLFQRIDLSNPVFADSELFTITFSKNISSSLTFRQRVSCFDGATLVCTVDGRNVSIFHLQFLGMQYVYSEFDCVEIFPYSCLTLVIVTHGQI